MTAICATAAGLLALAYGLRAWPPGAWLALAWPADELHGLLALALALTGAAEASQGRRLDGLRLAAAGTALLAAAVATGAGGPATRTGTGAAAALALGVALLAATQWPPRRSPSAWPILIQGAVALLWVLWCCAVCFLIPGRMLLDWLPLDRGLSWPAVVILALLAVAATRRVYCRYEMRAFYTAREDRQILAISLALLLAATGAAAMLVAALLAVRTVNALQPMMHRGVVAQAMALDQLVARVVEASGRAVDEPGSNNEPAVHRAAGAARLQRQQRDLHLALDPLGQVALSIRHEGKELLADAALHGGPWLRLRARPNYQLAISLWGGLVVQLERSLTQVPGSTLVVQVKPLQVDAQMSSVSLLGADTLVLLCIDDRPHGGAQCLSAAQPRVHHMPLPPRADGQAWPIQLAWASRSGVTLLRDPQNAAAAVAFAPVGQQGLGVVHKLLLAPLMGQVADTMLSVWLAILAVVTVGAWLLYLRIFPSLRDLRHAKACLQATLDNLPQGVLTLDAGGSVLDSNRSARALSGTPTTGRAELAMDLARDPARDGTPHNPGSPVPPPGVHEAVVHTAGGQQVPVEAVVERFDFEGESRSVLILRDLRGELAHRDELSRWEYIFRHAHWAVATTSADGQRLDLVNPAYASLHGHSVEALRHRPITDLLAPVSRETLGAHLRQALVQGHLRFDAWGLHRDNSSFPVVIDVAVLRALDGTVQGLVLNVQDMTEQNRAMASVRRSEALLQQVLKSLPVGIWISDRDGRVQSMNPAVERLWRGPIELRDGRPIGRRVWRVEDGQQATEDDSPTLRAIRSGRPTIAELYEIECPDGSHCTLMNSAVPLLGPDGAVEGAIAVNEDLTALHRAEAAILAAKNLFENLFHASAVGMAVCDGQGRFERVNPALCALLCRTEAAMLASALHDVVDPQFLAADLAQLARLRDTDVPPFQAERRWRRCDGRLVWVLVVMSPVQLHDTRQQRFLVQVLDIDHSHRIQMALQASEARLLNANRIAQLADWEWDCALDRISVSALGRHILALPLTHSGAFDREQYLALVHADDRELLRQSLRQALTGDGHFAVDYRLQLPDGHERVLHQQGEWMAAQPGQPARMVGVLQDITARKQAENELLRSRQRLRALSANEEALIEQERRHIAREVHDELGQALTALKMEISVLRRQFGDEFALAERTDRMTEMVDGTLDIVRHVVRNLRPAALDFGLVAALEWLADDFGHRWEIPCDLRFEGTEFTLSDINATALFRIAQESLTNVARHARARRVEIELQHDGQHLHLRVRDDGVGFDLAAKQDIGSSFGLLGMRERALKIGAALRIESQPDSGTTVHVELPLLEP